MRPALLSLLLLGGCAAYSDTPADPRLANVVITYMEMTPEQIAIVGKPKETPAFCTQPGVRCTVLAFSIPMPSENACLVVLPPRSDPNWERLKRHEERHCHGENHDGRARFADEAPY